MLIIDDRENPKLQNALLLKLGDRSIDVKGQAQVQRLETADYIIGDWGIEAKEINDFYRSIMGIGRNGRTINNQLAELSEAVDVPFLVVYGNQYKPYRKGKRLTRQEAAREIARMSAVIKKYKMNLYTRHPTIRYMEFPTMEDFIEWLCTNHTQKGLPGWTKAPIRKKLKNPDPRLQALTGIDGISESIAQELLDHYGGLKKLMRKRITQRELMGFAGVGRERAKKILKLREDW